jgi:hypothetical protein
MNEIGESTQLGRENELPVVVLHVVSDGHQSWEKDPDSSRNKTRAFRENVSIY